MNWLSTLGGVLAGLFGRELWEWLPTVTRALIKVVTWPLSPERREIRRNEWNAELKQHFKQRRISGLLWVLSLLPVCLWEAATEQEAFRRFGIFVQIYLFLYVVFGSWCIPKALEMASDWGFSTSETIAFMAVAPIAMSFALMTGISVVGPILFTVLVGLIYLPVRLLGAPVLVIFRWTQARSRRVGN